MKIIIGADGQLGWELQRTAPAGIELVAIDIAELDVTKPEQVNQFIEKEKPDWVINAAAYTAVDKAEDESELAYRVNCDGALNIAKACKKSGAKMLQVSTDFVFDGKQSTLYLTTSKPNPLSVYGASKQAGDEAVLKELGEQCTIVRTSWLYSAHGNNFVKTMLRLMPERSELGIVADQIGTPTWANGLARAIWSMLEKNVTGIQHWSDNGVASWYDFTVAIYEEGTAIGLIENDCNIKPINSDQYPVQAERPAYSVLDKNSTVEKIEMEPREWRDALIKMLDDLENISDTVS
ncbi:MAG: dTDP-4-dehydrorhamnose reductase [Gammaproteobacteria bacterium]|nr:dTDP-4-dehydrorhamnose reductase [Gammaproteobacteria bacterium]